MHNKISAVVITLNEEAFIDDCIRSLYNVADEIVVVDSFSTDGTEQICAGYDRVRFVKHTWQGYSQSKNYGNTLAQYGLILSLDADERLDEEAIEQINELKNSETPIQVCSLNRKNYFGHTWIRFCGWYPDVKVRLFDRLSAQWEGDYVHELLQIKPEIAVQHISGNILHHTVANNAEHLDTIQKYARLAAEKAKRNGKQIQIIPSALSALIHFLKIFFLKLGFLHGSLGLRIAYNSAKSKWLRYTFFKSLP